MSAYLVDYGDHANRRTAARLRHETARLAAGADPTPADLSPEGAQVLADLRAAVAQSRRVRGAG